MVQVEITDTKDIQDVEIVTQAGEDSSPPDGSDVVIIDISSAFRIAVAADDGIEPTVEAGEKEIYSITEIEGIKAKLARIFMGIEGDVEITPGALPVTSAVKLADGDRDASGVEDTIRIDAFTDPELFTWLAIVGGVVGTAPPTTITGKITSGTAKVKIP
jgi:hypothetical protein